MRVCVKEKAEQEAMVRRLRDPYVAIVMVTVEMISPVANQNESSLSLSCCFPFNVFAPVRISSLLC